MSSREKRPVRWIGWVTLPLAFIYLGVSIILSDAVFICWKYGQRAYFVDGLHFIKHKPYTLSNGEVLSQDLGSLIWAVSAAIWLALIVGTAAALVAISALVRKVRKRFRVQNPSK